MGEIVGEVDTTSLLLYAFWLFFFYLVYYLQKESRREGYPLESDETGKLDASSAVFMPDPKTYKMPHGHGDVTVPNYKREEREIKLKPLRVWSGAPKEPTGSNPMLDGVGPGAYAERADVPDLTAEGEVKIVPLRTISEEFKIVGTAISPIGMRIMGCDGEVGGIITDVWVDTAERMIRFYEVDPYAEEMTAPANGSAAGEEGEGNAPAAPAPSPKNRVLVPANFTTLHRWRFSRRIYVGAITGPQFKDVPRTKTLDQVTLLEEDKIYGYFGAGTFYATPQRRASKFALMQYQ